MSAVPLLDAAALAAAGRAPPVPFRIASADGELTMRHLLRVLPGKRVVGEAMLNGRPVLAKLFVGRNAERHWRREHEGIAALLARGIPTPALRASAALPAGGYLLLTDFVPDASTLADDWRALPRAAPGEATALAVLRPAYALLGRMHAQGLVQEDLHLGNFLRAGETVQVIDGDSVRALPAAMPLPAKDAQRNLAILLAQLPAAWDASLDALLAPYRAEYPQASSDRSGLLREVARIRDWRLQDYLAKTVRDCSLFAVERNLRCFSAVLRSQALRLHALMDDPDVAMAAGEMLKDGNTCTVVRVAVNGGPVIVKRYNIKDLSHALSRSWRPSRGWHSWREAHRLKFLGISTPAPLAIVEERLGPLRRRAWLVTEFCDGADLAARWRPDALPPSEETSGLLDMVSRMRQAKVSHGDFKATNLIWHDGEIVVIDLDAMVQHRTDEAYRKAWRRDRARLLRNWPADSVLVRWLDANLPSA